jgi:two-component system chemotaxis response regulator CheB
MGLGRRPAAIGTDTALIGHMASNNRDDDLWLVVIAASLGGVKALGTVLNALPGSLPAAIVVVQHRPAKGKSHLEEILMRRAHMPVVTAESGNTLAPGVVYVSRPDLHLTIRPDKRFAYVDGTRIRFLSSSSNPLLATAAPVFDGRLVAVVLTGGGTDATDGVQEVKAHGGVVIAQDRASSESWSMPESAVRSGAVDYVLPLEAIGPAIEAIVEGRPIAGAVTLT